MRKAFVAAAAVIVIVGLGAAALPLAEEYSARQIKAGIEAGGSTVEAVEVGLLARRVTLHKLHVRQVGDVSIGRWEASGLSWPLGELLRGRTRAENDCRLFTNYSQTVAHRKKHEIHRPGWSLPFPYR